MKSLQIANQPDADNYTNLIVLKSAAGYYIGSECWDENAQAFMPGTRDTDYFDSFDSAAKELVRILTTGDTSTLRQSP